MSASALPAIAPVTRDVGIGSVGRRGASLPAGATPDTAALAPLTLAFRDPRLEQRFQVSVGADGLVGYRLSCILGAFLWLLATQVVPVRPPADPLLPLLVGLAGATMNMVGLIASRWTHTLDRQNAFATPIAIANGAGALVLASSAGVLQAYGSSALVLIGAWFFVARVRFVFAMARVLALMGLFAVAAALQPDPRSVVLDAFILFAALGGVLLGLYRMELTSRRLFRTELTIVAQSEALARENAQSQELLLNILPAPVARRLRLGEETIAQEVPEATVLFADLVGFTPLAHGMPPAELVHHLDELFSRFDHAAARAGVEKIKTIGDAYMAVGGVPEPLPGHPERVVGLGLEMIATVERYAAASGLPLALRVGVHTGPLVAGVIGTHKFQYDLWGDTVNIASRLEATGVRGTVQVSARAHEQMGDGFAATHRGLVPLKGVGSVETWLVHGLAPAKAPIEVPAGPGEDVLSRPLALAAPDGASGRAPVSR